MLVADQPFDLAHHPYLRDIYSCTAREMIIDKASQRGISEYLISYALHACDQRNATVLYLMPTNGDVSDFSSARVNPSIEASPYLTSIVMDSTSSEAGANRVFLKRVRNRHLYLRGSVINVKDRTSKLKTVAADVLIFDEYDEMMLRSVALARKRLDHSLLKEIRLVSTPTYPGRGVHAAFLASDQREWMIKCEACNERQLVTLASLVTEFDKLDRPARWHEKGGKPYLACVKCGAALKRNGAGEWVAKHPDREVIGFHVTKLLDPAYDLAGMLNTLRQSNEDERKECYNQDLAEPYQPRGTGLTDGDLDELRRDYGLGVEVGETCFMGVDVGGPLHTIIRGQANARGERPLRFIAALESFEEVLRLIRRFNVKRCVIDALPETKKAIETQAQSSVIWLAYYDLNDRRNRSPDPIQVDEKDRVVDLSRTRTLDALFDEVFERRLILPNSARDVADYYTHMQASIRVLEANTRGITVARYIQKDNKPDHYAHAENYCLVAEKMQAPPERRGTQTSTPDVVTAEQLMEMAGKRNGSSRY